MKIEAFFRGIKNTNEVVDKLKSEGINAYADINDHYQLNMGVESNKGHLLSSPTNSGLVINSGLPMEDRDKSPLLAASPMVSGMGNFEEIEDINYRVIVDTDSSSKERAEEIIKSLGGSLDDPNLNIQNHVKAVDLTKADPGFLKTLK
ncbi:hypothetical protein [Clostridium sp. JN-1]|uniref:hypothetical protein n=1 Tax=Clostridium sp. JN-1 TaxID=2483110 RepID=UPI000F0B95D9|nr:hypothetical protein [Clostridium sp. JN-1]